MKLITQILLEGGINFIDGKSNKKITDPNIIANIINLLSQLDLFIISFQNEVRHSEDKKVIAKATR